MKSDDDHIGGAASVISNVTVDQVLMPDYTKDNEIYLGVMDALDYGYLKPYVPAPDEILTLGSCTVQVMDPINNYEDPNNNSIILIVTCGDTSFIFIGDAEENELNNVASRYAAQLDSDVYKVGHLGAFPDGNSVLMLVRVRLRHVAGTDWGLKRYMNMEHLLEMDVEEDLRLAR